MDKRNNKNREDFFDLLMQNQMRIYAFILSMVRNYADADDILQNTVKTMWEKYEEIQPIDNFVAWGVRIANYKILDQRKKKHNLHLRYDNQLFEKVASLAIENQERRADERVEKLERCLKQLKSRSRKIIELRYYQDLKPQQISARLGLSITNVYKIMSRIHGQLLECVKDS